MRIVSRIIHAVLILLVSLPPLAAAAPRCDTGCENHQECRPYGGYCRSQRRGWYGGRREVRTEQEAREVLTEYFAGSQAKAGNLKERETYFEAEVFNPRGLLIDRVIVDKRTGRIRSIY